MLARNYPDAYIISARIGLAARGVIYLIVAGLLLWAALSPFKQDAGVDVTDAFMALEQTALGRGCLLLIGAGLLVYALWRWATAILNDNNPNKGEQRVLTRLGMAISGAGYAFLAVIAIAVTFGANDAEGPDATVQFAQWLFDMPFGKWLLMAAGLVVAGFGLVQFWLIISDQWRENLRVTSWGRKLRPVAFFGVAGRAVLFLLIAFFLMIGGWRADMSEVKGIAETLGWLRAQHYGLLLYLGAGSAIGGYGVFSLLQAHCYTLARKNPAVKDHNKQADDGR